MKKYSWNFNGDAENWYNDSHDTIEECLEDASAAIKDGEHGYDEPPTVVSIGENMPFVPCVDVENVLDILQEQAYEFCGEVGGDWAAYDYKKKDELEELSDGLTAVVNAWLEKYGRTPQFYAVENIKLYPLFPAQPEEGTEK